MPEHPLIMMKKGNINPANYMLGFAEKEGIWRANYVLPDVPNSKIWADFVDNFDDVAPLVFGIFGGQTSNEKETLKKLVDYYKLKNLGKEDLDNETIDNLIDVLGDSMFNFGIDLTAKLHAEHSKGNTYYYHLTYPALHNLALFRSNGSVSLPPFNQL